MAGLFLIALFAIHTGAQTRPVSVPVLDGVVQPRRPIPEAIRDAMNFLKKADGDYVPGRLDGELAGYFTRAHVNPDGTRATRQLAFPARQHAYFIFTFLRYYAFTGENEWRLRARDLADWNLAHSTPPDAVYSNVPYSTFSNGKPGGSKDVDSIEPDKCAFLGSGYIAVYEATGNQKYLEAASTVAATLIRNQRPDGSWPFRVVPETGAVRQDFGGAPVFFVEFFDALLRHQNRREWQLARDRALELMIERNVSKNLWGTYHEDIALKPQGYLSAEPMSFTADYLFRHVNQRRRYLEMGREMISLMEERLVHTEGHAAAPAPAVSEQAGFEHLMPGHTARYCRALADLYAITKEEEVKQRALSGIHAVTYMQSPAGLFRTYFASVNPKANTRNRPDWYSQHLYTVCHILEAMSVLPELSPTDENHVVGGDVFVREIRYAPDEVTFATLVPARTIVKLSFTPNLVESNDRPLRQLKQYPAGKRAGWFFDSGTQLLTIQHASGKVIVRGKN